MNKGKLLFKQSSISCSYNKSGQQLITLFLSVSPHKLTWQDKWSYAYSRLFKLWYQCESNLDLVFYETIYPTKSLVFNFRIQDLKKKWEILATKHKLQKFFKYPTNINLGYTEINLTNIFSVWNFFNKNQ